MTETDLQRITSAVSGLSQKFTMTSGGIVVPPADRFDQMRSWLHDPILRAEAALWAEAHGVEIVFGDYGMPIDLIRPGRG